MTDGHAEGSGPVALIVGPGDRFLSGVSYYTALLTAALADRGPVAALLLRRLCPELFYPGRSRVGRTDGSLPLPDVPVYNGLDWFWGLSAWRAWRFWRRTRPRVVVLQWWTATVLHSYLMLSWLAKRAGARLVIEFHEMQDVGEASLPFVGRYTRTGLNILLSRTDAVVVHSDFDRRELIEAYPRLAGLPIAVVPHGPYAHHGGESALFDAGLDPLVSPADGPDREGAVRLLIFGVVRPYKGHLELAEAVESLVADGTDVHLTVVGEVWNGYREPLDRLQAALPAHRLTIVDRYVADEEVPGFFAAAHIVVLPYRRSSASGPLHIAMSRGMPVVTTSVGGLVEATTGYTGAVLVPPEDAVALADGIRTARSLIGVAHEDPHSWHRSADRYADLLRRIGAGWSTGGSAIMREHDTPRPEVGAR
ncbi:glycosyltransferase family 4 protein [Mycobacterium sp. C3-094]